MGRAAARVIAGRDAGGNQACAKAPDGDAPQRCGKVEHQGDDQPPWEGLRPVHAQGRGHRRTQHEPGQPGGGRQSHGGDLQQRLGHAGLSAHRGDLAQRCLLFRLGARFGAGDELRQRTQPRVVIEIAHGHGGVAIADVSHQRRRGQGGTAEVEEIGVLILHGYAEGLDPELG